MPRRNFNVLGMRILAVCLIAVCAGCREPATQPADNTTEPPKTAESKPGSSTTEEPAADVEPQPRTIPEVKLTEPLAETCLVRVGDTMPEAKLPALGGAPTPLREHYGEKLTVLFFWTSKNIYATAELQDLTEDVAAPFAEKGVRVIGVNEGDAPEQVAMQLEEAKAKFDNFLDPNGAFFAKVAKEKLPRTYLLDARGKILWFDIEYSATTRRDILQAIQVALGEE